MSQNNMIAFITLTDLELNPVEINPAFIMMMQRDVSSGNIPFTKLTISFNNTISVTETPEQIAELQMNSVSKVMESVMVMTQEIVGKLDEQW